MSVQGDRVGRNQPHELSRGEDDFGPRPNGFEEEDEAHRRRLEVTVRLVDQVGLGLGELQIADEEPDNGGHGEEDRGDDESVVVTQTRDQSQAGGEGTTGAGNFVEDMHHGVHATQFLYISTHNVARNHSSDELHHPICNAGDAIDGNNAIGIIITVIGVSSVLLRLHPVFWLQVTAGTGIDHQQDGGENAKDENGGG